jgi:hypothetical protein
MGEYVAAAPQRLIVGMGDDNSGAGPGFRPYRIEWDGCHCSFRNETEHRPGELFSPRYRLVSGGERSP